MGRTGTVEEMADMIAWLSSEECSFSYRRRLRPSAADARHTEGRRNSMTTKPRDSLTVEDLREMYRIMLLGRRFTERALELAWEKRLPVGLHPSAGQEAVGVGACYGLRPSDWVAAVAQDDGGFLDAGRHRAPDVQRDHGQRRQHQRRQGVLPPQRLPGAWHPGWHSHGGRADTGVRRRRLGDEDEEDRRRDGLLLRRRRGCPRRLPRGPEPGRAAEGPRRLRMREQPLLPDRARDRGPAYRGHRLARRRVRHAGRGGGRPGRAGGLLRHAEGRWTGRAPEKGPPCWSARRTAS